MRYALHATVTNISSKKQPWSSDWPKNLKSIPTVLVWANLSHLGNQQLNPNPPKRMVENLGEPKNLIMRPAECFVCFQPIRSPFMMRVGASTLQSWKNMWQLKFGNNFFPFLFLTTMEAFAEWISLLDIYSANLSFISTTSYNTLLYIFSNSALMHSECLTCVQCQTPLTDTCFAR